MDSKITVKEKTAAILTLDGRELVAKLLSPADTEFTVESAEQKPPQAGNSGVSRLMVRLQNVKGNVQIAVLLSPVWKDGRVVEAIKLQPLAQW